MIVYVHFNFMKHILWQNNNTRELFLVCDMGHFEQ